MKKVYALVEPETAKFIKEHEKEKELVECISRLRESVNQIENDPEEVEDPHHVTFIDIVDEIVFTIKMEITKDAYICEIYNASL